MRRRVSSPKYTTMPWIGAIIALVLVVLLSAQGCQVTGKYDWAELGQRALDLANGICPDEQTPQLYPESQGLNLCDSSIDGIQWDSVQFAQKYIIQFSLESGKYATPLFERDSSESLFEGTRIEDEIKLYNEKYPNQLSADLVLYYHVQSDCLFNNIQACKSAWSQESFITKSVLPERIDLTEPTSESYSCTSKPTFAWDAPFSFISTKDFVLEISKDNVFDTATGGFVDPDYSFTITNATQFTPDFSLDNGTYYWHVKYQGLYCYSWSNNVNVLIVNEVGKAEPLSQQVDANAEYFILECDKTPLLAWTPVEGADSFETEVWVKDSTMDTEEELMYSYLVLVEPDASAVTHEVLQSLPNGEYQFRVRGTFRGSPCQGDWMDLSYFTIMSDVPSPVPTDVDSIKEAGWVCTPNQPLGLLSWGSLENVTGYRVQITSKPNATTNNDAWSKEEGSSWDSVGINPNLKEKGLLVNQMVTDTFFDTSQLVDLQEGLLYWRVLALYLNKSILSN